MKYSNTVEYNISTKLDSSGLTQLQTQIKQIELNMQRMANRDLLPKGRVEEAKAQLEGLSSALTKSFDPSLGMLNLAQFRSELQQSKVTAEGLKSAFSMTGSQGAEAFGNLAKQIGNFNNGIERSSSSLDKMFTTFSNTFRWGLVSSFFSQFMNAIHNSVDYVKELDDSLTQIMLVTDYNRDSMNEYAKSANEAAKALSMSTTGMTNASLVFAQQGYDLNQSQELATLSAKLANASQQDTATTSDQITAYMNAYGLEGSIEELTQQMDNWALIANVSAADVGELAQASQRAASMANAVGVSGEQLAAQIATIESVTREAPEQIGNGLKTLYARFSDIAAGGEDEDGFGLGKVTAELDKIGVQVLNEMGQIRDVGDIMEDLMVIWDDLDQTSKVAASQALAGKYQVNRFMALMDNSDMYQEYKGATGNTAAGTLDAMNQEYAESLAGRSQKLETTLEGIFNNIFNTDSFYPFIDIAQKALDLVDNLTEAMGGGLPVLTALVSGFTQLFSTNIARGINDMMSNQQIAQTRQSNLANVKGALADTGLDQTGVGQYIQAGADRAGIMNGEQYAIYTDQLDNYVTAATNAAKTNEHLKDTYMLVAAAAGEAFNDTDLLFKDEEGINTSTLIEVLNQYKDSKALMSDLSKVDFSTATKSAQDFAKALSQLNGDLDRIKTGDRSGGEIWDIEQAEQDLYKVQEALYDLHEAGALTDQDFTDMKGTVEEAFNELADTGTIEKTAQEFDKMNITIARFSEALQRIGPETLAKGPEAIAAAVSQEVAALQAEAAAAQGAEGVISNLDRQNVVNSVVTLTSSLGQLASAWLTIQNLGSIWSNENLSGGEKFLQTILNLSMVIGQVTSAFDQLNKAQKTISTLYDKLNSVTEKSAEALKKNADAAKQAAEGSAKDTVAKTADTAAKTTNMTVTERESNKNKELAVTENMTAEGAAKDAAAQTADAVAKTGATAATTGLTAAVGALKGALDLLTGPVGILITIFGMLAGAAWGAYQANIEQMKEDAQEAFDEAKSKLDQLQSLKDKVSNFGDKYDTFKESGEGGKDLITEAREIAQAMKDAGAEEEANAIHLAVLKAEAQGTADNFDTLASAVENAKDSMAKDVNEEVISTANKVLENQDTSAKEVLMHQKMIKDYQEELNNLDPLDAGYEEEKERLEHLIDTLKSAKLAQEDLVNAANAYQEAQGRLAGMKVTENQGLNLYAGGQQGQRMTPDSAIWFENANLDYNSIERIYSNMVEGFSDLSGLEKAQFILESIGDEAGKTAAQIELLMLDFNNLNGLQIDHLQNEMAQGGLTLNQQQLLTASLDKDTTAAEFSKTIQDVLKDMDENNTTFEVALKARLKNPEEFQEAIRQQVESYEPKDSEIGQEDYNSMTTHFYENKDKMGEEGSGFEDYSENLFNNAEALSEVIEDTLRYNDAIEEISDNLDNWIDTLNRGEKNSKEYVDAVDGLKDTFSDFLGIPEELSEEFVTTQENLDDLQLAADGNVDAFKRLQNAAAIDLAEQLGVDSDTAVTAVNNIQNALDELGYSQVDIGDIITFEEGGALDAINAELDNLCLDADQAAAYLESAFGIKVSPGQFEYVQNDMAETEQMAANTGSQVAEDMTVTPEITTASAEQVATDEKNYTNVEPQVTEEPWSATLPVTGGGIGQITTASLPAPVTITGSVPRITYNATPQTSKETKTDTALATGVRAEQGGSGVPANSHVNLKPGSTGTRTGGGRAPSGTSRPSTTSGGGGSCFVAGTKISTYFGFKNIEDIQKNDIVLSYNEKTQQNEYSIVLQTMIHNVVEPIYTLYIKNEQLRVTGIHRFLVKRNNLEWIPVQNIKIGDWILFADGTWHLIWKIDINIEHQIVYNFEVSNNHNYYVGYNQILAHNKGGKGSCFVAGTLVTTDSSFKPIEQIQKDDIVLSYNEKLGINEYSKVLQTMIHNTIEPIYTLYIKNEKLRVTGIHRFFVTNKIINGIPQWVHAADLKVGDWVLFADGTWHVIHKIDIDIEYQTVYNFEVSHNHNYYVGRNQILAHNKGGKGGGGGGGGSAKTIKPKEKKEHEKNYYEEVNNQLKKNEKVLSKIEKENDRLTGDKARANYDKQIELLKKEISLQEKKLKILTEQEKVDVEAGLKKADKELEDLLNQNNITWKIPDPIYDEDGIISNYEQISEAIDKAHNEMIDKYNAAAAAGDEELTKQIEEQISKIDKKGEDLLKKAKRMNEIQTEIEDITATLEDLKDSVEDIRIEVYKASQEALKDLKKLKEEEAEIDALFHDANPNSFIDRWTIDGTPFVELKKTLQEINSIYNVSADDARAYYDTLISEKQKALETASEDEKKAIQSTIDFYMQQKGLLSDDDPALENGLLGMRQRNLEQLKKWMDNPSDPSNPFGDNIAALKEAYQEEYEAALEDAEHARELGQEARDEYLDTMEGISDEMDRHIDKYDILLDQLENISDAYQLYYGEDNYDDILNIMNQQANVAEQKMQQLETAYNYWLNRYDEALKTGNETIIHDAEERLKDVQSAYADAAKEAAEYFVAIYEKTVESSIQKMTNKLWGGGPGQMDLEDQSTIWELQKDYMSNYKDDVEKSFEIDKLRSKYISLLNDAQGMSLQTQNKIRAQMQDQLDLLQDQATMSEYDVKLANAKLEILQKQIALEDAQRNKNKMQLRRDTQGNYRYVYTADQGDVQQAQDELNESKYDAYEMTKEQTIANNDRAISLYNDYMEKVAAISKKYQDDEAAREAALAALSDEYREIFKALREDYADTTNGMYDLLTWMIDNTTSNTTDAAMNMLDRLYDKNGEVKENTGIAWRDLATNITDNVLDEIEEATQEMLEDINISAKSLASTVAGPNGPLSKIGATANTLTGTLNKTTSATAQLGAATRELFGYLAADDGELARATNQMGEYEEKLKGALSETSKLGEALRVANENLKAKTEEALNYKLQIDRLLSGEDIIENGRIVSGEELRKRKEEEAAKQAQQNDNWSPYSDAYGIWMHGDWGGGGYWYGNYAAANGTWKADQVLALFNSGYGYSWMDTGGYTGDWTENEGIKDAKSGKLAVLHKKELVLNATDTENILGAVSIIRKLSNTLQNNLGNLAAQSANQNNISGIYSPSTTEQRVEIQATFPNATDADDIRTALLGLSDKAFQYAHRTI